MKGVCARASASKRPRSVDDDEIMLVLLACCHVSNVVGPMLLLEWVLVL